MNQSKFSLADVLTVLAAFSFGFVCFLSLYFFSLGNTTQSILLSSIISLSIGGTALGAKLLKLTDRNFKICFIWEIILLILFTCLTILVSYAIFPHYFAVSGKKSVIQEKLMASIIQAENMFSEYERYAQNREDRYENQLRSIVISKDTNPSDYLNCGFTSEGITDDKQCEEKMFTIHADLFPTNYSDPINKNGIKEVASVWLSDAKAKITGWKPIGIVKVINEVEQNSNSWLSILVQQSTVRERCEPEAGDFSYPLSFDNVKTHFSTFGNPTSVSVSLSVLAYFLMILSYLITKRSSKSTICKSKVKGKFSIDYKSQR